MLTRRLLKQILHYDPETGIFTWICTEPRRRKNFGKRAGSMTRSSGKEKRYRHIKIEGSTYKEHRLAFLYMKGKMPEMVDHKDKDTLNNKWSNLRAATQSQNQANKDTKLPMSGFRGVRKIGTNSFYAKIKFQGVEYNLGRFDSGEKASQAYEKAAKRLHKEFYRGNDATIAC